MSEDSKSATKPQVVKAPCIKCATETKHEILCKYVEDGPAEYNCSYVHMVIECRGCGAKSFRYVFSDFEQAYPTGFDDWEVPQDIQDYPKVLKGHKELEGLDLVPEVVAAIYQETLIAIREDAPMLAGLGLRATIEAICKDRSIKGKDLDSKISKLATEGLISRKDAERLHGIRFMGNDAAHDIKKPQPNSINIALRIVEHLISTVYILEEQAKGHLDTQVSDFEEFKAILEKDLSGFTAGDEYPLAKFLGKDVRRVAGGLSSMEVKLKDAIAAGSFDKLSVGKVDAFGNLPGQLQHFVVT